MEGKRPPASRPRRVQGLNVPLPEGRVDMPAPPATEPVTTCCPKPWQATGRGCEVLRPPHPHLSVTMETGLTF